jgi:hypothetical protein
LALGCLVLAWYPNTTPTGGSGSSTSFYYCLQADSDRQLGASIVAASGADRSARCGGRSYCIFRPAARIRPANQSAAIVTMSRG